MEVEGEVEVEVVMVALVEQAKINKLSVFLYYFIIFLNTDQLFI